MPNQKAPFAPTQPENTLSAKTGHNNPPPPQPSSNMSRSAPTFRYRCGYVSKTSFASKTNHDSAKLEQSSDFALGLHHLSIEELLCLQLSGYSSRQIITASFEEAEHWKELAAKASAARDQAKRILDKQAQAGVTTIPYYSTDYPCPFYNLHNEAPPLIHVSGNKELLHREDCVAIIGARAADTQGQDTAYHFARQIGEQNHVVISGLALGCDTAAHRGCLDAGGPTLAIVASGLDITHPKANKSLQDEIVAKGGAILSEHPFGMKANPTRLVARCRMQVSLPRSVIVAQCPILSGTMHAVRFAQQYDNNTCRQLYAVQYNHWNELNSGNKFLLDQGIARPIRPEEKISLNEHNLLECKKNI